MSSRASLRLLRHRRGPRRAARGVPGRQHLQDPVPRGRGPDRAGALAGGLPPVHPRRRRAAAVRPDRPARPVPAAPGDPGTTSRRSTAAAEPFPPDARPRWPGPSPTTASGAGPAAATPLTRAELLETAGLDATRCSPSWRTTGWSAGRGRHYDGDALVVARTAAALAAFGVEPRHLRTFKAAADREVALVEQVVAPLLRQRGPGRGPPRRTARQLAALSVGCTPRWSRPLSTRLAWREPYRPLRSRPGAPVSTTVRAAGVALARRGDSGCTLTKGVAAGIEACSTTRRHGEDGAVVRQMEVVGVRVEMPSNQPIVLLRGDEGERYLPIWIGAVEATAIAFAQQGVVPAAAADPRPVARRPRRRWTSS